MTLKNWSLPSIVPDTITELAQGGSGKEVAIISLIIANNDSTSSITVDVRITDSSDVLIAYILPPTTINSNDVKNIEVKFFLNNQEKVKVQSNLATTTFIMSGDEFTP